MSKILINSHGKALMNNDGQVYKSPEKPDLIEALCNDTLTSYSNSNITKVKDHIFSYNKNLISVDLPNAETIGFCSFSHCSSLVNVSLLNCKTIDRESFLYCSDLTTISLPLCTSIPEACFRYSDLTNISLPLCTSIGPFAFGNCKFTEISLPICSSIKNYAFQNCFNLTDIYLGYEGLVSLANTNVFALSQTSSSHVGLKIHVRSEYADQYTTATNWSALIDNGTIVIVGDYSE